MFRSMRRAAPILILLAASLGACHKVEVVPEAPKPTICFPPTPANAAAQLLGRWELTQTSGGLDGRTHPADPARKQEIVFSASGQVQLLLNGAVVATFQYSVANALSIATGSPQPFIISGTPGVAYRQRIDALNDETLAFTRSGETASLVVGAHVANTP